MLFGLLARITSYNVCYTKLLRSSEMPCLSMASCNTNPLCNTPSGFKPEPGPTQVATEQFVNTANKADAGEVLPMPISPKPTTLVPLAFV